MKQQQQKHGSGTIIFYSFCHERMDGEKSPTKAALLALSSFFLPYEERPTADVLCVEKGRAQKTSVNKSPVCGPIIVRENSTNGPESTFQRPKV